jgi:hypothetical protein
MMRIGYSPALFQFISVPASLVCQMPTCGRDIIIGTSKR